MLQKLSPYKVNEFKKFRTNLQTEYELGYYSEVTEIFFNKGNLKMTTTHFDIQNRAKYRQRLFNMQMGE